MTTGDRIRVHPWTAAFYQDDHYGVIVRELPANKFLVKMDRFGNHRTFYAGEVEVSDYQ